MRGINTNSDSFPGCGAARSDAPLIRDRNKPALVEIPGLQCITALRYVLHRAREMKNAQPIS
jgi:hypothetical protein